MQQTTKLVVGRSTLVFSYFLFPFAKSCHHPQFPTPLPFLIRPLHCYTIYLSSFVFVSYLPFLCFFFSCFLTFAVSSPGDGCRWNLDFGVEIRELQFELQCAAPVLLYQIHVKGRTATAINSPKIATSNVRVFSYNSLRSATDNFHPSNRIGVGGFGVVYKGVLRDGTQVAIKSLSAESKQGKNEFMTEITTISNIKHPNLVELIGCCVEDSNRILVYEYMENHSLATSLLGSKGKHISMDWSTRAAICIGTASGLEFLHETVEPPIVHRDIKASNILLDGNLQPKIGDFGLAKLFPDNVTHVTTRVAGTMGYLAPEYALLGQLTKKADVYSFGILMLEIISGRSSSKAAFGVDLLILVEWAWKLKNEGRLLDLTDPELTDYPEDQVLRFIKVAMFCTQAAVKQRPSMNQVVEMLTKNVHLNEKALTEPGIYKTRTTGRGSSSDTSSSLKKKGKQSVRLTEFDSSMSVTQMAPR